MFFARSRASTTTKSLVGGSNSSTPSRGKTVLESAFRHTKGSDDKVNVVGELVNMKVKAPVEVDFAEPVSFHAAGVSRRRVKNFVKLFLTIFNKEPPKTPTKGPLAGLWTPRHFICPTNNRNVATCLNKANVWILPLIPWGAKTRAVKLSIAHVLIITVLVTY